MTKESTLKKAAVKTALSRKEDVLLKEDYISSLIEEKTVLVRGVNFNFSTNKKAKRTRVLRLYCVTHEGISKDDAMELIKSFFVRNNFEINDNASDKEISTTIDKISVPEYFTQKRSKEALLKKDFPAPSEGTGEGGASLVKARHDLVVLALSLNGVLALEKKRDETSITMLMPDHIEKVFATDVLNSFAFKIESCLDYCIKVIIEGNISERDVVKITKLQPTDKSRFKEDLAIAIMITKWEILRQGLQVILPSDNDILNNDTTKSTPFKMVNSGNKGISDAADFISFMMKNYGVDIQSETKDPYIFRVLSPSDLGHAGTSDEQDKRTKSILEKLNPLSVLLKSWGYCLSEGLSGG